MMIYTLEYLRKEAEGITGNWNGTDDHLIDANGNARHADDVQTAEELLEKITEIEELIKELEI